MKIIFTLNHPAHYYLFKFIILGLEKKGHIIEVLIKDKDILEKLLLAENRNYVKISKKKRVENKFSIIFKGALELLNRDIKLFSYVLKSKPDLLVGTDIAITHIGKFLDIPALVYNEDDFEINKFFCNLSYPFATHIIAPEYTSVGKYTKKKIAYNGIQKTAYLNKKYFKPDIDILKLAGLKKGEKYVIIRLVSLTAGHDVEGKHVGLSEDIVIRLIPIITQKARLFITGEDKLPKNLEKYHLSIPVNKMHDLMAFASLFIGDSQSMCAEAGILGTPFIRFNDFVGKIESLNDLENNYGLGWGVKTDSIEKLLSLTKNILADDTIKEKLAKKRMKLFNEKIDIVALSIWFIENYPESVKILNENPDYQNRFK